MLLRDAWNAIQLILTANVFLFPLSFDVFHIYIEWTHELPSFIRNSILKYVALLGRPRRLPEDVVLNAADHLAEDVAKVRRLDVQEDLMRIEEQHPRSTQADGGQLLESTSNRFMSRHQFTLPLSSSLF